MQASFPEIPLSKAKAAGIPVNAAASNRTNPIHEDVIAIFVADCFRHFGNIPGFWPDPVWEMVWPCVVMKIGGPHDTACLNQHDFRASLGEFL
jgi:hypothetical protein